MTREEKIGVLRFYLVVIGDQRGHGGGVGRVRDPVSAHGDGCAGVRRGEVVSVGKVDEMSDKPDVAALTDEQCDEIRERLCAGFNPLNESVDDYDRALIRAGRASLQSQAERVAELERELAARPITPLLLPEVLADPLAAAQEAAKPNVPYPEFCRHPDKCAGRSTCPRDPCCCD
jgi:hypothetical protein